MALITENCATKGYTFNLVYQASNETPNAILSKQGSFFTEVLAHVRNFNWLDSIGRFHVYELSDWSVSVVKKN